MDNIFDKNIKKYNTKEETAYLYKKDHRLRGDVALKMLDEVIDQKKNQNLLSVACSIGLIEEKMIKNSGLKVYGVDGAKEALDEAKKRGVITTCGNVAEKLPYENEFFDFVFAGEIIEHLIDTKDFLFEIHRVLKPGGYLILTTPNLARFDDRIKFLFGKTPRHTTPVHPYLYLHIRPFTYDSLKNSLITCGFNNIVLRSHLFVVEFFDRKVRFNSEFLAKVFPSLSSTLIVRAQKK